MKVLGHYPHSRDSRAPALGSNMGNPFLLFVCVNNLGKLPKYVFKKKIDPILFLSIYKQRQWFIENKVQHRNIRS